MLSVIMPSIVALSSPAHRLNLHCGYYQWTYWSYQGALTEKETLVRLTSSIR